MSEINEVLKTISDIIEEYESGQWNSEHRLKEMNRILTCNMYYLTKFQVEFQNKWNSEYWSFEGNNAQKEREADKQVPELYQCRKIIEAAKGVSISIGYELRMDG